MRYEVDVTIARPLDDRTRRLLEAVQQSANGVARFEGDPGSLTLTVEVSAGDRTNALRAAAGEVARVFPGCSDEKYAEPREL
jgi:hypothetical protein